MMIDSGGKLGSNLKSYSPREGRGECWCIFSWLYPKTLIYLFEDIRHGHMIIYKIYLENIVLDSSKCPSNIDGNGCPQW